MTNENVIGISCPKCGVTAGNACERTAVNPGRRMRTFHDARVDRARSERRARIR